MKWMIEVVKANSRWQNAFAFVLLCLAAIGSIFLAVVMLGWTGLLSSDVANWVQAVGSIAAIIGTARLADRARKEGIEARNRDVLYKEIKAVNRVLSSVTIAQNRVRHLRLLLQGEPAEPTLDSIEKVKDCLPMLTKAFDGLDEAGGMWAQGQMLLQQLSQVVRAAEAVQQIPTPGPQSNDVEFVASLEKRKDRVPKADHAIQSASVALQTGEQIDQSCRAFIANPSIY